MVQPRFPGTQTGASSEVRATLFQRVFGWMFAGLLMTAIIAVALSNSEGVPEYLASEPAVFWGIVIAQLVLVFALSFFINRMSVFVATFSFFLYAALNGVTFTLILAYFQLGTIAAAFFIAAGMFGLFALFGYFTKIDLSKIGSIALMLGIGLILASVVNIFFLGSDTFSLLISYALVALFCIITAFDVQKIKEMSAEAYDEETASKLAIFGALMLYLDFIIIFKNLLNILSDD